MVDLIRTADPGIVLIVVVTAVCYGLLGWFVLYGKRRF